METRSTKVQTIKSFQPMTLDGLCSYVSVDFGNTVALNWGYSQGWSVGPKRSFNLIFEVSSR